MATRAGKMELSCSLGTTCFIPQEKFPRRPYNKSFIYQACSVKMAGYWPSSVLVCLWNKTKKKYGLLTKLVRSRWLDVGLVLFFCEFMDLDFVSVHKHAKRTRLTSSHLERTSLVINHTSYCFSNA